MTVQKLKTQKVFVQISINYHKMLMRSSNSKEVEKETQAFSIIYLTLTSLLTS